MRLSERASPYARRFTRRPCGPLLLPGLRLERQARRARRGGFRRLLRLLLLAVASELAFGHDFPLVGLHVGEGKAEGADADDHLGDEGCFLRWGHGRVGLSAVVRHGFLERSGIVGHGDEYGTAHTRRTLLQT